MRETAPCQLSSSRIQCSRVMITIVEAAALTVDDLDQKLNGQLVHEGNREEWNDTIGDFLESRNGSANGVVRSVYRLTDQPCMGSLAEHVPRLPAAVGAESVGRSRPSHVIIDHCLDSSK